MQAIKLPANDVRVGSKPEKLTLSTVGPLRSRKRTSDPVAYECADALTVVAHGHAGAFADGADANVVEIDVPSLLVRIVAAAAGEGGVRHNWKIVDDRAAWPAAGACRPVCSEPKGLVNRPFGDGRCEHHRFCAVRGEGLSGPADVIQRASEFDD